MSKRVRSFKNSRTRKGFAKQPRIQGGRIEGLPFAMAESLGKEFRTLLQPPLKYHGNNYWSRSSVQYSSFGFPPPGPRNFVTNGLYTGVNYWLLNFATNSTTILGRNHYPAFATFKQINKLGGHVRKGEHAVVQVGIFQDPLSESELAARTQKRGPSWTPGFADLHGFWKWVPVFHWTQCEDLPEETLKKIQTWKNAHLRRWLTDSRNSMFMLRQWRKEKEESKEKMPAGNEDDPFESTAPYYTLLRPPKIPRLADLALSQLLTTLLADETGTTAPAHLNERDAIMERLSNLPPESSWPYCAHPQAEHLMNQFADQVEMIPFDMEKAPRLIQKDQEVPIFEKSLWSYDAEARHLKIPDRLLCANVSPDAYYSMVFRTIAQPLTESDLEGEILACVLTRYATCEFMPLILSYKNENNPVAQQLSQMDDRTLGAIVARLQRRIEYTANAKEGPHENDDA